MKENGLLVPINKKLKAVRTIRPKPRANCINQYWGIDMTKLLVQNFGWLYLVIVLDWYSKKIVGYHSNIQGKTKHWLIALNMAINKQFPLEIRQYDQKPKLVSDNGNQPTSIRFMQEYSLLRIEQIFTNYNNPR